MARWRKESPETGVRIRKALGYDLVQDGAIVIRVRPIYRFPDVFTVHGWYFVTYSEHLPFTNSAHSPVKTPEEAKEKAMAYFKKHWSKPK